MSEASLAEILTAEEAAEFLKIPLKQLHKLALRGEIPAKRLGRMVSDWRFYRSMLIKWLEDWQPNKFDPNKRAAEIIEALNGQKKRRI